MTQFYKENVKISPSKFLCIKINSHLVGSFINVILDIYYMTEAKI